MKYLILFGGVLGALVREFLFLVVVSLVGLLAGEGMVFWVS